MTIMKAATFLPPPTSTAFAGALNKRQVYLSLLCLIIVTLLNTHSVTAAPAKLDSLDSTFPLDLQPPIFEATASASSASQPNGDNNGRTIDSYGIPIESLQPVETPDGRKVVSAQGLQFEIPNYASGITELKKPADDLLPPFIGEFSNDLYISTSTTDSVDDVGQNNDDKPGIRINNKDHTKAEDSPKLVNILTSDANLSNQQKDLLRYKRQLQYTIDTNINSDNFTAKPIDKVFETQNTNTNTNNFNIANTTTTTMLPINHKRQDRKLNTFTTNTLSSNVANSLSLFASKQSNFHSPKNISSLSYSSSYSSRQYNNSFQSPSFKAKLSAHNIPISNGNFNYPNLPTDPSIINRIVSKYKNPLPTLDPIVVALPNAFPETFKTNPGPTSSNEATGVDVESVPLVEVKSHPTATHSSITSLLKDLPDYILELNDPDIGGAVAYKPSEDMRGLNVIAWDLLPPLEVDDNADKSNSRNNKLGVATGHNLNTQASQESSHIIQKSQLDSRSTVETTTIPNYTHNRGRVSYTSSTTASTTPKTATTTKTTTPRTTTTTTPKTTTTTTRRTTTPRTTTTTITTSEPDSGEFFKLEAGDSYTLPTWLQDIDDPDLDVAVTYIVPEDIHEYNHTVDRDLVPPLEPYTDLNNLNLTPPPSHEEATTTSKTTTTVKPTTPRTTPTTTTTTRRPSTVSTVQPHWIRARPTSPKPTITTFSNQFTSLSPSISSTYFAQRTTSTTTTTTVKPKSSLNFYNQQLSPNIPQTDQIGHSGEEVTANSKNPFSSTFDDGKYKPRSTTRRTTTTTTTTTTTPAPEIIEKNPFEPTLPTWLKDFDYPDLGPGVPFVYDPNEDESPVDKNILPPSKTDDSNLPSNSPFLNSQTPQSFTNKFTSSAIPLTSSIPSIVTNPLPSTQTNQDASRITQPPLVFTAAQPTSAEGIIIIADKSDDISKKTSSTFNQNFPAPFDPNTGIISTNAATGGDQKKVPLSADRESFPPFNNAITGSSAIPSKTTFTKSEDGKVITNNIFLSGSIGSTSAKPIGSSQPINSQERTTFTTQSSPGSTFTKSTTSAAASGFVTVSGSSSSSFGSSSITNGSKYTGRFGGPPGVLAPQDTGSGSTVTKPTLTTFGVRSSTSGLTANNNDRFKGSFGGPPGVLKPYDNVKNR